MKKYIINRRPIIFLDKNIRFLLFVFLFLNVNFTGLNAKIYDAFIFFNELELLSIRFEELDPVVDYFVIVESTKTFTGRDKPLYFFENKEAYETYLNKVIHVVVDRYPGWIQQQTERNAAWSREEYQRNAICKGLIQAEENDLILISDVDEIPDKQALLKARELLITGLSNMCSFSMELYRYQLNRIDTLKLCTAKPVAVLKSFLKIKNPTYVRGMSYNEGYVIDNGGWHFTSMGGKENVIYKINSFSHAYDDICFNQLSQISKDYNEFLAPFKAVPIEGHWPIRILRLKDYYESIDWIAPLE